MSFAAAMSTAMALLALAGCATATSAVRNGQPVVTTTIAAIEADPNAWEGKWARLDGWLEAESSLLLVSPTWPTERGGITVDSMDLDPQKGQPQPAHLNHKRVAVSGMVSLVCVRRSGEIRNMYKAWEAEGHLLLDVRTEGPLAYCDYTYGPYLEQVLIRPLGEQQ